MAKPSFSLKEPLSSSEQRTALIGWSAGALVAVGAYLGALQFLPNAQTTPLIANLQPVGSATDLGVDPILTGSIGNAGRSDADMAGFESRLDRLTLEVAALRESMAATQASSLSTNRRVESLEESLSFMTASIGEQATGPAEQPLPQQLPPLTIAENENPRVVLPAPVSAEGGTVSVAMRPLDMDTMTDSEAPIPDDVSDSSDIEMDDMSADSMDDNSTMLSATPFAIDIGGAATLEEMDALWMARQASFDDVLDGFSPRILLQQTSDGALDLRLVAGPIQDAADAAMVCAQLVAAGMERCLPAVFDGQQLALSQ